MRVEFEILVVGGVDFGVDVFFQVGYLENFSESACIE